MTTLLWSQVNVTTFHYDNARTGQNIQETVLTPENVNVNQFGKLFTISVDGYVYAQPLYLAGVQNIAGGTHNVLYIATEHDSVFAIDADTGAILWQTSFINPGSGVTTVSSTDVKCAAIIPEIGITSTPVIDLSSSTLYLVAKTEENGQYVQRLHALDVTSGTEKFGGPVVIAATVNGTGDGGQTVSFNSLQQLNRPGLLLENGQVVIAWASNCDHIPYHGWVMSYSASTLAQEGVFNSSPDGAQAGVWMSGDGVAADVNGNYYLATGNGSYSGSTSNNYGDSIVRLGPASNGTLPVLDWFTPWNQNVLSGDDSDVGSAGVLLLPDLPAGVPYQHLLVQMGKEGTIYLVNRDYMGGYCSSCVNVDTQIVQEIGNASVGVWGSPAYWNDNVYWVSNNDSGTASNLMAFSFNAGNSGLLSTAPTSQTTSIFGIGTGTPVVAANGTSDGIVWLLGNAAAGDKCCQVLYAFDATDLSTLLYRSNQAAGNRDVPGGAVKFTAPVVANGKVYVGSQLQVSAYGLIATTKSTLTASANPAYVTQPITYTATVTGPNGTPTGSVVFYQGSTALATVPLSNAQATYSTSYSTNGTYLMSASYSGSGAPGASYPSTSAVLKETVNLLPAVSTTKLTASPTSIYVGQSVALTATVSSTFGTPPNGETVTFTSSGVTIGTGSINGGVATLPTSALAAANHLLVAIYSGDANFKTSQGTDTTEVVKKYPTTTVITSNPNPSNYGQATILTAQVTTSGPSTPTGWVTFLNGTTSLGVAAVNGSGVATLTTKQIPLGSNSLTASYTDSPMYANSVSAPITQVVNQP